MQSTTEKGRLLEVATKLYLENQGFTVYFWQEWASQKGLPLQDTGIDLVAEKNGELYAVQCKNWDRVVSWRDVGTFVGSLLRKDLNFKGGFLVAKSISKVVFCLPAFQKHNHKSYPLVLAIAGFP